MRSSFILLLIVCTLNLKAQTKAHDKSSRFIIDPTYNSEAPVPEPDIKAGAPWLYGETELESWRLQLMRISSKKVAHNGYFPGVYHQPFKNASFRCAIPSSSKLPEKIVLRAIGDIVVSSGGLRIYEGKSAETDHIIDLTKCPAAATELRVDLSTTGEPPCLLIESGPFATSTGIWEWSDCISLGWKRPNAYPQTKSGIVPHRSEIPGLNLKPLAKNGKLFDFGREILGYVVVHCQQKPAIIVGESVTEALDTVVTRHEQTLTIIKEADGIWKSQYPLAFRYVQIKGQGPLQIEARAQFYPVKYRGAFACSDDLLTKIWMTAAYTHRLCENEFILDGIKRDRLPWIDNMNLSAAVESYTFSNPEMLRKTISVLGRAADQSDINNIVDYNSLWVISQDSYQRYFNDLPFLRNEWPRIYGMIERMSQRCDKNGLIRWHPKSWIFIDWVNFDKNMSEQIMWYWALRSGIRLAERIDDKVIVKAWTVRADSLKQYLLKFAWDKEKKCWTDPDKQIQPTRHAAVLSIVSNLSDPNQYKDVMNLIEGNTAEPLNSPSMIFYEIRTLTQMGKCDIALRRLREVWGAMLEAGATTFWEGFDKNEKGDSAYRFYDRPYGKSLCHAWGAGPAALLPEIIFGLRPTGDGWSRFNVDPCPALVEWANVTIPTSYGNIQAEIEGKTMTLVVPAGTTAEWKTTTIKGPQKITVIL